MFNWLTWGLFSRGRHSSPLPRVPRADLRLEQLETRLTPSTIDWNQTHQTIDGFGASSAWVVPSLTAARANLLFSPTQGIGLSLVRSRIFPDTSASSAEVSTMQTAQNLGATVFSTPWSPPAAWKDNGTINNGGHLLASHYQDYADLLSQYVRNMQARGITIHAVSIANEPDQTTTYESSRWTPSEFAAFLPVLANTFARDQVTAQIILPEESGWRFDLASSIFSDPTLAAYVGIVAGHNYSGSAAPVPQAQGKGLWETEVSSFDAFDPSMSSALRWAKNIHDFMVLAHANAWNYWWLKSSGNDNQGLLGPNWEVTKRLWAVGNYSRFVRPGWVNIGSTDDGGVLVSAFKDPVSGQFAIVAVNQGNAVAKTFNLHGLATSTVTPWVTSAGLDLAQQADITVDGSSFATDLAAQSVTTFVGAATLPDGWTDQDIGSPGQAGSASYDASSGTWAVNGGGSDIWNASDQFNFASQYFTGDGSIVAQVTSVPNTDPWAKAGVMFRDSADPGAPHVDVLATPGNGVVFQWRTTSGGQSSYVNVTGLNAPLWVQLVRSGDAFTASYSSDGVTWTQLGDTQNVVMSTTALAGLAVTSSNDATINAANFTNVSLAAQFDLSPSYNQNGLVSDGATFSGGGLDGNGNAYSANLLGSSLTAGGATFNLGAADGNNVVQAAGQTIALAPGQFSALSFLGTAVNGSQLNQTFTINYTDGSSDTFNLELSDWQNPQGFVGESVAATLGYYNAADGSSPNVTNYLYQYTLTLNKAKTVSSLTLPVNANVLMLAVDLLA